jgi:hypothetical protein
VKNKNTPQPGKFGKTGERQGGLFSILTVVIALAVIGINYRVYWLLYLAAAFILLFLYFFIGSKLLTKYLFALFVLCNPYKYYRYLRTGRAIFFFVRMNKNDYKTELAIGLRNIGKFEKAKRVLLSTDCGNFSTAELLVLYYNNLCDLLTLLNDYTAAREAADKGFSALEKLTDEKIREVWEQNLTSNLAFLRMREGDTKGCEKLFTASLERTEREYERIEEHTNLGTYYFLTKQQDKALVHFEYVVRHGNKLFHVKKAKEYIAEMKKEA